MSVNHSLIVSVLAQAVTYGTPILFAALGELLAERSGVLNLGVEGMMLVGALAGFAATARTGSPWIGALEVVRPVSRPTISLAARSSAGKRRRSSQVP